MMAFMMWLGMLFVVEIMSCVLPASERAFFFQPCIFLLFFQLCSESLLVCVIPMVLSCLG